VNEKPRGRVSPRSSRIFFSPVDVVDPDAISSFVVGLAYHFIVRTRPKLHAATLNVNKAHEFTNVRALTVAIFVSLYIALTRPVVSAADAHCSKRFRFRGHVNFGTCACRRCVRAYYSTTRRTRDRTDRRRRQRRGDVGKSRRIKCVVREAHLHRYQILSLEDKFLRTIDRPRYLDHSA